MTDLTKGIIEIDGFTLTPQTTLDEMLTFFGKKVRILELSTGPRVKLQQPFYLCENIYAYAFNFNKDGTLNNLSLIPVYHSQMMDPPTTARGMIAIAKEWLKKMINDVPSSESEESICYSYGWGYIHSATRDDIHYGLVGGEINIRIGE